MHHEALWKRYKKSNKKINFDFFLSTLERFSGLLFSLASFKQRNVNRKKINLKIYSRCALSRALECKLRQKREKHISKKCQSVFMKIINFSFNNKNNGKRAEHKWTTVTKQSFRCWFISGKNCLLSLTFHFSQQLFELNILSYFSFSSYTTSTFRKECAALHTHCTMCCSLRSWRRKKKLWLISF